MYDIDFAGYMVVRRALYGVDADTIVTASIDKMDFKRPSFIGDIVIMTASIKSFGKSSINVRVKAVRENTKGEIENICSVSMVFVAIKNGKPMAHNLNFEKLEPLYREK
jgi:acyl-CoA hydrolase